MTDKQVKEIERRVKHGVKLLNRRCSGWRQTVNGDTLNIAEGEHCILGQVFGSYRIGTRELFSSSRRLEETLDHGFLDGDPNKAEPLTIAWRKVL